MSRCRLVVRLFMMATSEGRAPTMRAEASCTVSSTVTQGSWDLKCPSTPYWAHLSSSAFTSVRTALGCSPKLLPHRYTAGAPSCRMEAPPSVGGNRYSSRKAANGSLATMLSANVRSADTFSRAVFTTACSSKSKAGKLTWSLPTAAFAAAEGALDAAAIATVGVCTEKNRQ